MTKQFFMLGITIVFVNLVHAYNKNSPVGQWVTYSEQTHQPSAVIELYENQGKLQGKIAKIYPGENRNPYDICKKCPDAFSNKPILGLEFLWDFVPAGEGRWTAGHILDPREGKIYKGSIRLVDGGKRVNLRGYWGVFWRTQTWTRLEEI